MIILSICICSLVRRKYYLHNLKTYLDKMAAMFPGQVEILIEVDNGEISTGKKRNILYQRAQGEYVSSIDDDDWVYPYYIEEILNAVKTKPDAVAMNGVMTTNGRDSATWDISRLNPYMTAKNRGRTHYLRFHNHLSPIKREIALQYPFPDKKFQEDYDFGKAMADAEAIKTEVKVKRPMYEYRFKPLKRYGQ